MNPIYTTFALLLLLLTARAGAEPGPGQYDVAGQSEAELVDRDSQATDIAIKSDAHDRMTVAVRLSGLGPFQFLIDTGADRTAISTDLARRLRLEERRGTTLHSVTGASEVGTATVPLLNLDAKQLTNMQAALLDAANMGADGILGLDSLRSQRILFDFKARTLTVVPSVVRVLEKEEPGTIIVRAHRRKGRLVVTEARAESIRITVVVDTGAEATVGNSALRARLAKARVLRSVGPVDLLSVTGETLPGELMFVKSLEIGGVELSNVPVVFADSHAFGNMGLDDKPALLLGMNTLRAFQKVSIDFARMRVRLVLPEKTSLDQAVLAAR